MKRYLAFLLQLHETETGLVDLSFDGDEIIPMIVAVLQNAEVQSEGPLHFARQTGFIYETVTRRIVWRDGKAV